MFAIWSACARFGVKPPGVKDTWDECDVETQARLVAFHQLAENDDWDLQVKLAGAKVM